MTNLDMLIVKNWKKVFVMNRLSLRVLSALLALLTAVSVMSTTALAAEYDAEDESAVAETGSELEPIVIPEEETVDVAKAEEPASTGAGVEQITKTEGLADGIRLTWTMEADYSKMAVYRKISGSWHRIGTSDSNTYVDTDVESGTDYTYTIRALSAADEFVHDTFDTVGVTIRWLKTPSVRVENDVKGVRVSWDAIEGAFAYRVYYRNSKGYWTKLTDTSENSAIDEDVSSNVTYTYTVRCLSEDGKMFSSFYDTAGKSVKYIAAPVLTSANGTNDGIQIVWKASAGAAKYRVFYKNSQGGWSRQGDTTATSLLDTNVRDGGTYTYTVRCLDSAGNYCSSFDPNGIQGTHVAAPVISAANGADGVDIKWNAVSGAEKYRVYYYGSKGWTRMADTDGTSYTDQDVSSNSNYMYLVRCIDKDATRFTSGSSNSVKIHYYEAPTVKLSSAVDGVQVSWNAVAGGQKYRLYYKGANGWTRITDTASTSYLDKNVTSGKTYTYTVRCINNAADTFLSYFKPGVSIQFVNAPEVKLELNDNSITVNWDKVEGAALYRVYHRTANGWTRITDTANNFYEDKSVQSGNTYTYTVRCLNAEANAFTSFFRDGKSVKFVTAPKISSVTNTTKGVKISWSACEGAEKYRVYYKNGSSWTRIGETTGTSFEHTAAESGKTYTYTVRCINNALNQFQSSFDKNGKSIKYIASPKNLKAEVSGNSIKISWTHSAGAEKYRVYYFGHAGWTKMAETTQNYYVDSEIASGNTYRYTVRCISADGKSFTSDCDLTGVSCKYNSMPVLNNLDFTKDGIVVSWKASPGAEKYRVYYYGSKGWTRLTETTATSVVDREVASGNTYRYTVRCISADGKQFTSDCDLTGKSVYYVAAPKLVSTMTDSGRVTFTWNSPRGASKYRVYKKVGGTWARQTDTTSNTFTDTAVSVGSTYTYTVRVINSSATAFCSGFDPTGFIITVVSGVKGFVYYDQTKYDYPYGDNQIADSGCGPTSFAMIASTLLKKSITPIDAVKWCGNSFYLMGAGTYWSYFPEAADHFGITLQNEYGAYEIDSVISELKKGRFVISSQGPGRFTKGGHFIVLAGVTSDGKIIVYDPNGANHYVGTAFTPDEITDAGTHYWSFSK